MKRLFLAWCSLVIIAACGGGSGSGTPTAVATSPSPTRPAAALISPTPGVTPIAFPLDEAPHEMLSEWWYYTGHLFTRDGTRYGFEFVFFQANRSSYPTVFAAHFAISDNAREQFRYDQKVAFNAREPASQGFSLRIDDWSMSGALGSDHLAATMAGYGIDLDLLATKPPALHNRVGYFSYGDLGGSYYYSRTRMNVTGTLTIDGSPVDVTGEAWMDHQWGNFVAVGGGGWDWFALQLSSGEDLTVYLVRDASGSTLMAYGTYVDAEGTTEHLEADDFTVTPTSTWTSPRSGATYPSGWTVSVPAKKWQLTVQPTLADQELDTSSSTRVIYWEGEATVSGTIGGDPIEGLGYVELTGYMGFKP